MDVAPQLVDGPRVRRELVLRSVRSHPFGRDSLFEFVGQIGSSIFQQDEVRFIFKRYGFVGTVFVVSSRRLICRGVVPRRTI